MSETTDIMEAQDDHETRVYGRGQTNPDIQLLRNYSYMLLKEIKKTPVEQVGDIEWFTTELNRVNTAIKIKESK